MWYPRIILLISWPIRVSDYETNEQVRSERSLPGKKSPTGPSASNNLYIGECTYIKHEVTLASTKDGKHLAGLYFFPEGHLVGYWAYRSAGSIVVIVVS